MAKKSNEMASVLAFEKKLVPSDGMLYGTTWEQKDNLRPIQLHKKSVRGTISNRLKETVQKDPAKLNAEVEKANLQTVDAASLALNEDTLAVKFTLKVLAGAQIPSACNNDTHNRRIQNMGKQYIEKIGFSELAKRYAQNLANARFIWRNRLGAENLEVKVVCLAEQKEWTFAPYDYSLKKFADADDKTKELAVLIEEALAGKRDYLFLEIIAFAKLGEGQEVYPSEELVLDKGKGTKSKVLYEVEGTAGLHSQKIGNALRTIDTWYPEYGTESGIGPIAVEPYGAVTNLGKAYRNPKDKVDFYTLFDQYTSTDDVSFNGENEAHYMMAVLVRGGVFGQSGKE